MNLAKTLLVIGTGNYQYPGILKAKQMGLTVIGTDYDPNAIGAKDCDHFYVIDVKNKEENLKIAQKHKIDGVVSFATEIAVPTVSYIAERLNLPGIDYETAINATNKLKMRQIFEKERIPSVKFFEVTTLESLIEAVDDIGFPAVLKPADSSGSRGVTVIHSKEELSNAYNRAIGYSREESCIVEEFFEGIECTIEGFSYKGNHTVLAISQKEKPETKYRVATELFYPPTFTKDKIDKIEKTVTNAVVALGIDNGMTHTEVIINESGDLMVVEVAARGGGFGISNKIIEFISGFDPITALILLSIGENIEVNVETHNSAILKFYAPTPGILEKIIGVEKLKDIQNTEVEFFINEGEVIPPLMTDGSRTASIISWGKNREEVSKHVSEVEEAIEFKITPLDLVFLSFGNKKYGLGHISRDRAILSLLRKEGKKIIAIQNTNPFNFDDILLKEESSYEKFLEAVSTDIQEINSHVLLLDLPFNEILLKHLPKLSQGEYNRKIIAMDFFDYQSKDVEVVINLVNHYLNNQNSTKVEIYSGIEYSIIRDDFGSLRTTKKLNITEKDNIKVLITCGTSDPKKRTIDAVKQCEKWQKRGVELDITIVLGHLNELKIEGNYDILTSPESFPTLLSQADLALISGGTTALEACFLGTPIIIYHQTKEEIVFSEWLEEKGVAIPFDSPHIDEILNVDYRKNIIDKQWEEVDGLGAQRIVDVISKTINLIKKE